MITTEEFFIKNCHCIFCTLISLMFLVSDVSCLVGIEHFNVVWSFSVEYMHLVLLGATKRYSNYLFNSKYSTKTCYVAPRRRVALNKIILAIKPTSAIARKPRSINQRSYFKASEYRSFLLYYLPIVLPGFVPNEYVKHIRLLSAAVYTLLKENISFEEIKNVEEMLKSFVKEHQNLFGKENMVMVIHMLEHAAESVRQLGPMWAHSAFPFERNNGRLLKWVNGTSDVIHQISTKYALSQTVHEEKKADLKSKVLLGKGLNIEETATHVLSISSLEILNFSNINLFVHKRIRLKNVVYTSVMYTRPKRSIDYFIGLDSGHFGTAKYYFEANGQIFVMMNQFKMIDNIYHILKVKPTGRLIVAPVDEICKKYLFINIGLNSYIVCPPNSFEKE